jgi:hypothetical protein
VLHPPMLYAKAEVCGCEWVRLRKSFSGRSANIQFLRFVRKDGRKKLGKIVCRQVYVIMCDP